MMYLFHLFCFFMQVVKLQRMIQKDEKEKIFKGLGPVETPELHSIEVNFIRTRLLLKGFPPILRSKNTPDHALTS